MTTSPVQLYAELLGNIRQVSISASFAGAADPTKTTAEILPDGLTLRIQHIGQTVVLTLPGRVAAAELPLHPDVNIVWRLPVAGPPLINNDDLAPWSAPDLPPNARVSCRACDAEIVTASTLTTWKDLPSDNWAEMMEFWHCHKPDTKKGEEKDKDNNLADRGYGANSVIAAEKGIGFVDLTTLLLSEEDCLNLLFSVSSVDNASDRETVLLSAPADLRGLNIFCQSCRAQIGYLTIRRQQSVHLFKWQVSVSETTTTAPSISDCVAATLIATIQRTGSSKSLILPIYELEGRHSRSDENVLQIWVLNSNISYAAWPSSTKSGPAIKLLYKFVSRNDADTTLDSLNSDVQEINLPSETIAAMASLLEASTGLLPERERWFREWKIGLLERWRR
ncbi:E3 ubiquitin-protein ligase E3D [Sporothrix eucalyptigena]|uniref:E3 ubiquitin-protein ligase E3D n=1 Tax=Sporothrix eucalyptigena TaxID=1812306 RepID=A0ABP0CVR9_9PEZI